MKLGIVVPQGFAGEFAGWAPDRAWARTLRVARQAEELGAESVWVYDHVGTFGTIRDEPTLEAFAVLGALATATHRVRIGPLVARALLRNPALLAKHVSTLDVISAGRLELGLGAAAPRDETLSYGYPLEDYPARVAELREALAIIRPLFAEGRATVAGERRHVRDAVVNPRGLQVPRIPLTVAGNRAATWRVAAEFADEVNLDGSNPAGARDAILAIAGICRDVGRDPASLAVSVHVFSRDMALAGEPRVRLLVDYAATGISRVMAMVPGVESSDDVLASLVADARRAGIELG